MKNTKNNKRNLLPWGRLAFAFVAILAQFILLFYYVFQLSAVGPYIYTAFVFISLLCSIRVWVSQINNTYKLTWILLIVFFPFFGGILYIVSGVPKTNRLAFKRYLETGQTLKDELSAMASTVHIPPHLPPGISNMSRYLSKVSCYPSYRWTQTRYLPSGEAFFKALLEDLRKAERFIFIEFFIISEGSLWQEIFSILKEKAAQGVEIRLIYDDIGSIWYLPRHFLKKLRAAGIRGQVFNPLTVLPSFVFNNRDHRKIVVIDGSVAYTGGANIADEYINEIERFGHWKDAGVRLEGHGAWSFTTMFLTLWDHLDGKRSNGLDVHREFYFVEPLMEVFAGSNATIVEPVTSAAPRPSAAPAAQTDLDPRPSPVPAADAAPAPAPAPDTAPAPAPDTAPAPASPVSAAPTKPRLPLRDNGLVIPYDDIPETGLEIAANVYRNMINRATHSIFIMTPYLVLDEEFLHAFYNAADSGVQITIVTPHIPDKPYVLEVTRSYYKQLIQHGIRIFEYTPGFVHSKVMLVDNKVAVVGTVNFDYRSFYLHMECAVWMYGTECIKDIQADFEQTLPQCLEITAAACENYSIPKKVGQAALRLFAPLM